MATRLGTACHAFQAAFLKYSDSETELSRVSMAFPADIGRKPASPARGSGRRLLAGNYNRFRR